MPAIPGVLSRTIQFAAVVTLLSIPWPAAAAASSPRKIYLNFSDGSQDILETAEDDASRNGSHLCGAAPFLGWDGSMDCGDRETCAGVIADLVDDHWKDFNVELTVSRPADEFVMAMIGPPSGTCQFAVRGISAVDCGNQVNNDLVFAFECAGSVAICAAVISHELGHAFGLVHATDPLDLMYGSTLDGVTQTFLDRPVPVVEPTCGASVQDSHTQLLDTLGPWPAGRPRHKDWGAKGQGCQIGGSGSPSPMWSVPLFLLLIVRRARWRRGEPTKHLLRAEKLVLTGGQYTPDGIESELLGEFNCRR
jgi:hypothetical protein